MVHYSQPSETMPAGHVSVAVALTGGMGLTLAVGLHFFGWLDALNHQLGGYFSADQSLTHHPFVTPGKIWIATASVAFGLAWSILQMPGHWRRITIWIATQVVILGWLPVAAIGKSTAPVGGPWVACAWAGLCAIIYAARHSMPVDQPQDKPPHQLETETPQDGLD